MKLWGGRFETGPSGGRMLETAQTLQRLNPFTEPELANAAPSVHTPVNTATVVPSDVDGGIDGIVGAAVSPNCGSGSVVSFQECITHCRRRPE